MCTISPNAYVRFKVNVTFEAAVYSCKILPLKWRALRFCRTPDSRLSCNAAGSRPRPLLLLLLPPPPPSSFFPLFPSLQLCSVSSRGDLAPRESWQVVAPHGERHSRHSLFLASWALGNGMHTHTHTHIHQPADG